jgi:hypothetical protein
MGAMETLGAIRVRGANTPMELISAIGAIRALVAIIVLVAMGRTGA